MNSEHRSPTTLCYKKEVTDEDLAIALHVIELGSFAVPADPYYRFTCPWQSIRGMFQALKKSGRHKNVGATSPRRSVSARYLNGHGWLKRLTLKWVSSGWMLQGSGKENRCREPSSTSPGVGVLSAVPGEQMRTEEMRRRWDRRWNTEGAFAQGDHKTLCSDAVVTDCN